MLAERRRKRSSFAGLALQYWLAAVARRRKIAALVLADSAGLLVAASFRGPEAEELAALAPLMARSGSCDGVLDRPVDLPFVVYPVRVDRSSLYLCAVGGDPGGEAVLRLAEGGIQRILTTH
jgi:hypothetical protein